MSGDRPEPTPAPRTRRARWLLKFGVTGCLGVAAALWWIDAATHNIGRPIWQETSARNDAVRAATTDPVQVKQTPQQGLEKTATPSDDLAKDLAQLKLALERDHGATAELAGGLAKI